MTTAHLGPSPPRRFANLRQAYDLALTGGLGALLGLYLYVELADPTSMVWVRDALAGSLIGGAIGFCLGASGPLRDGAWRKLGRDAAWRALSGAAGGALGLLFGELVIGWFRGGIVGRSLSWAVLGIGIGVSQGLAERSRQRLLFGWLGGGLGGFLGGLLFEGLRQALGSRNGLSQGIGIVILGAGLGLCLALVEQALRRAWVQVLRGRQEGRAYLLARDVSALGLDERAEVGLFGDPTVARKHAAIERTADGYILHNHAPPGRTRVNGVAVDRSIRLRDGDRLELGQTPILFRNR